MQVDTDGHFVTHNSSRIPPATQFFVRVKNFSIQTKNNIALSYIYNLLYNFPGKVTVY